MHEPARHPAPCPAPPAGHTGRILLVTALLFALLLLVALVLATAVTAQLLSGAMGNLREWVHITVDGRQVLWPTLNEGQALLIGAGLVALLLALLVALPLLLLLGLVALALGLVASALAATAPLLLLAAAVWLVWRVVQGRKPRPAAAPSTTIVA